MTTGVSAMRRVCLTMCMGLWTVWSVGCGPEPPKGAAPAAQVKGTLQMDGKPVAAGELHFSATGFPPRVLEVKDGAFAGEAPIGKNQVEAYIYVEGPPSQKYGGTKTKKNIVPERYWGANTSLGANVTSAGPNEFKFDIKSK